MTIYIGNKRISSKEERKIRTDRGDSPSIIEKTVSRTEKYEKKHNKNKEEIKEKEQTFKPQTQKTIDQLKSGEIKTKEDIFTVGGEIALSKKTAQAVAIYKQQQAQERQNKQREDFIESVQKDTKKRFSSEWKRKKEEVKKEELTPETDITQETYFTPDRKKSPQETMDKTTSIDQRQFMKLDNPPPELKINKDTFRGEELIKKQKGSITRENALERWGNYIDYQEQELLKGAEFKSSKSSKAINEMISLSGSTESISPQEFKTNINLQTETLKENQLTIKETANVLLAPAIFGVARGGKNVVYSINHPVETVKSMVMLPFMIPEVVSNIAKKGAKNPIGTITELGTELYLWGKVTKTVQRVARPKIIDTPIKAKNIKILETVRKNSRGKLVKDTQVSITTVKGKPSSRYFWQKPKTQPRKVINAEFERKGITIHKGGVKQTETLASVKGVIKLKDGGKKIRFIPKDSIVKGKPSTIYNLDSAYTGKTSSGVPLKGTTPKIKLETGFHINKKISKGYKYIKQDSITGIYKDGEFFTVTKKGATVKVPTKTTVKVQPKGTTTYKTKINSGELKGEIQLSGNFVKRKYIPKEKVIKTKPKYDIEIDNKGNIKVLDTKKFPEFHYTESGKLIKTGTKPLSPSNQKIISNIGKQQSKQTQVLSMETPTQKPISQTKTSPVVKVISKNAKPKTVSFLSNSLITKPKEETQSYTTEDVFQQEEERQSEILSPNIFITEEPKTDFKILSLEGVKSDQTTDSINKLDSKQKQDEIIKLDEDIIQEERIITKSQLTTDPIIRTEFKEKIIPVPILTPPTNKEYNQIEKKEDGYNVYMYENGKQVKANESPLPKTEAERLGRDIADNSLSASYKVSKTNKDVFSSKRSKLATGGYVSPSKFSESKSKNRRGFFVEKQNYRLDSIGERKGIKASQLIAQRKKNISSSSFGSGLFGKTKKNKSRWL